MKCFFKSYLFWSFVPVVLIFYGIILYLSPPFYTHDSYHYLHLSLYPAAGDSHSMGLSVVLYLMSKVSDFFNQRGFIPLFLLWNVVGFSLLFSYVIVSGKKYIDTFDSKRKVFLFLAVSSLVFSPIILGNLYLLNSVWTEMTNIGQVALFCFFITYIMEMKWWQAILICVFLSVWSFHTRYLMIVVPVAIICMGLLYFLRKRDFIDYRARLLKFSTVGLIGLVSVFASNEVGKLIFPDHSKIMKEGRSLVLRGSIFCTLRCDVSLTETDCSTPEGKELVENTRCTELMFGLVKFGKYVPPLEVGMGPVLSKIGVLNAIKWVLLAPFSYLNDIHDIEMGLFEFGGDTGSAKVFPEATAYYYPYLNREGYNKANLDFISLARAADYLFKKKRLYHALTVIFILLSIYVLFTSVNVAPLFLCFYAFGTFILFSYLNPHVPFRYLMQILTPAMIGVFYEYSIRFQKGERLLYLKRTSAK